MENIIYRSFQVVFQAVGILLLTGVLVSALTDIQKRAFESKRAGLTSMLRVNQQLVGNTNSLLVVNPATEQAVFLKGNKTY